MVRLSVDRELATWDFGSHETYGGDEREEFSTDSPASDRWWYFNPCWRGP